MGTPVGTDAGTTARVVATVATAIRNADTAANAHPMRRRPGGFVASAVCARSAF
jgi:hypothetical protein